MSKKDKQLNKLFADYANQIPLGSHVTQKAKREMQIRSTQTPKKHSVFWRVTACAVALVLIVSFFASVVVPLLFNRDEPTTYTISQLNRSSTDYDTITDPLAYPENTNQNLANASAEAISSFIDTFSDRSNESYFIYFFENNGSIAFIACSFSALTNDGIQKVTVYFELTKHNFDKFEDYSKDYEYLNRTSEASFGEIDAIVEYSSSRINGEYLGRFSTTFGSIKIYATFQSSSPFVF